MQTIAFAWTKTKEEACIFQLLRTAVLEGTALHFSYNGCNSWYVADDRKANACCTANEIA